jgi:hypothetical protein
MISNPRQDAKKEKMLLVIQLKENSAQPESQQGQRLI